MTNSNFFIKSIIFLFLILFGNTFTFSQELSFENAQKRIPHSKKVILNVTDRTIIYFELQKDFELKVKNDVDYLSNILQLTENFQLKELKRENDKIGLTHIRYQLTYQNVPIENSIFILHKKGDVVLSGNGHYSINKHFHSHKPKITPLQAIEIGKNNIKSSNYYWKDSNFPTPILVYQLIDNEYLLCYKTDIYSTKPLIRKYLFINTENSKIVKEINRIQHTDVVGTAQTKYNGVRSITTNSQSSNFTLNETGRGNGINTYNLNTTTDYNSATTFDDSDNNWTSTSNQDDAALDAHFGAEAFYDYFSSTFNRLSFDNQDGTINSYVHYDIDFVNAFWDGTNITYGDGDGVNYSALTSLEVIGHEMTHAVTQYSAGLEYQGESGALNESFSDIFGVIIDFYNNPITANYLIGDQFNITGNGFRDMSDPNVHNDPDTYLGQYWVTDPDIDYGGVHSNSGVQNYWFYLLVNGGSGTNDLNNNYSVTGIPMDRAANIIYRSLTNYLTSYSDYNEARLYSIQAALDLYGECSPEVISVTNAWYAVGVGNAYTGDVVANFSVDKLISCSSPSTVQFYNLSTNSNTYLWDFGDGNTSTLANPMHTYTSTGNYSIQLITNGNGFCNTSDTLTQSDFLSITNGNPSPIEAVCDPITSLTSNSRGITSVTFNTINKSSEYSLNESYQDFTCANQTTITAGNTYTLSFNTGLEFGKAWIDYNNNGNFETQELIYQSQIELYEHTKNIIIQNTNYYSTPLRLRIASSETELMDACTSPTLGQYEDYTVIILPNINPPVANFEAQYTTIAINTTLLFNDLSLNIPTTWEWYFEGANQTASNLQNPTVTYSNPGTYLVKLIVTNAFGEDTLIKESYINVVNTFQMCADSYSYSNSGRLIDSGGENSNYQDFENCSFTVLPTNPTPLLININFFDSEDSYDYLIIYDGIDNTGLQIATLTGYQMTSNLISNSGYIYFEWSSDQMVNNIGFDVSWAPLTSTIGGITHSGNLHNNFPITFNSIETNANGNYLWDFGDGTNINGTFQEIHTYQYPGNYTIQLNYYDSYFQFKTYYDNITILSTSGLDEINSSKVSIFPNPTNSTIKISSENTSKIQKIEIFDAIGQSVLVKDNSNYSTEAIADLSSLKPGIYSIKIIFEKGEYSFQKIVKVNE